MEDELRRRLEAAMGAAGDAELEETADDAGIAARLLASSEFATLRQELAADARSAAAVQLEQGAVGAAEEAQAARRQRVLMLAAVSGEGAIGQVLEHAEPKPEPQAIALAARRARSLRR